MSTGLVELRSPIAVKRKPFHLFACILILCAMPSSGFAQSVSENESKPRVLVLHSYHHGFTWSDNISRGIQSVFTEYEGQVELRYEFMDTRHIYTEEYFQKLKEIYQVKYAEQKVDVIIASDDHALNFVMSAGQDVFPNVPIVFCSVSGYEPWMRRGRQLTGLIESIDVKTTLDIALHLHPGTKEVAVITDMTRTGQALRIRADKVFQDYTERVRFRYLEDLSVDELEQRVSELPDRTIVFLFIFSRDREGRVFSHEQNLRILNKHCNVPVYAVWEFYLGYGIVGGMLTSGKMEGKMAGEIALRILNGENASDISLQKSPTQYMFDYAQMVRFGIKESALPADSIVVNKPFSFYQHYKGMIWVVILIILALIAVILSLVGNMIIRHRAKKALLESEERYRLITETATDGICQLDASGNIVFINEAGARLCGYDREELLGKNLSDLVSGESLQKASALLRDILSGKKSEGEITGKHRDGHEFPIYYTAVPIEEAGEITGISAIIRDITERKLAEERQLSHLRLLENTDRIEKAMLGTDDLNQMFSKLLDTVLSVFECDRAWLIYPCDPEAQFWRVPMERTRPEYPGAYALGEELPVTSQLAESFREVLASEEPLIFHPENGLPLPDSAKQFFIESSVNAALYPRIGKPWMWGISQCSHPRIWSDEDLQLFKETGRRLTDALNSLLLMRDLQESEEKYRTLVENANEAILVAQDGMLKFVNPRTVEITGYSEDELTGKPFADFIHPDDREIVIQRYMKRLQGESPPSVYVFRIICSDAEVRWVELSVALITWTGKPATLNFLSDITERKKAEDERTELAARLQRAEKMEALGTLAGGVAHDLNNILSGIVGYPDLLLASLPEDSKLRKPISIIQNSGQKAAAVVQDLLTLARRGVAIAEVCNLNEITSDYLDSPVHEEVQLNHPNVEFVTDFEEELLNVLGSPMHLSKTIMNLISNAAEAITDGGTVVISTKNQYVDKPIRGYDNVMEGDYVVLGVADDGVGIAREDLGRIFEPFYTKKVMGRSGTGLGMAVVWGTVKDHNGYINVDSVEGEGTTFELYFPVTRRVRSRDESSSPIQQLMGDGEMILVVDDIAEQRELAKGMLERLNYNVKAVSSGEEAVEYLRGDSADLLVLDMIMDPGIDGLETYRRALEVCPRQKAIIVSGFSETDRVREAQALGAGKYIRKPYMLYDLGTAVKAELG